MRMGSGDVVAGGGAVLMVVALAGMVLDLIAGVAPGAPWVIVLSLGVLVMVAALVWRFERAAAHQVNPTESLLEEARRRRAALALGEQTDEAISPAPLAA